MNAHLHIVEDESAIREMLNTALTMAGFHTTESANAQEARHAVQRRLPDLLLLDWMLPDISGVELAKEFRKSDHTKDMPIIMITAKGEEADKIRGLNVGADDYVTKPFSPRELVARIQAVLRRTRPQAMEEKIEISGLTLDPTSHRLTAGDIQLTLGPTEFKLLHFFMTHPERVYSRTQLLDNVWGTNVYVEERTVDVHIRRLRKALTDTGHDALIQTVRGTGYRFSAKMAE